jgi:hypothetical protein
MTDDDLTRIKGIGNVTHARLRAAGVASFAQLVQTPANELLADLAEVPGISVERIQEWQRQAANLALSADLHVDPVAGIGVGGPGDESVDTTGSRLVRHTFTVELSIETGTRRTLRSRVAHVQTGDQDEWAGWDLVRVDSFVRGRAGLGVEIKDAPPVDEQPPSSASRAEGAGPRVVGRGDASLAIVALAVVTSAEWLAPTPGVRFVQVKAEPGMLDLPAGCQTLVHIDLYARSREGDAVPVGRSESTWIPGDRLGVELVASAYDDAPHRLEALVSFLADQPPSAARPWGRLPGGRVVVHDVAAQGDTEATSPGQVIRV